MVLGVGSLDYDALRELHEHIHFDGSLRVSHDVVDLAECPAKEETGHDEQANGEPRDDGSVRLVVVDALLLFAAVKIQSSLVLGDRAGGEVALASHGPDRR